jgi:hypothetical protein
MREALKKPFKKLVENAVYDGGEKLAELKNRDHLQGNANGAPHAPCLQSAA